MKRNDLYIEIEKSPQEKILNKNNIFYFKLKKLFLYENINYIFIENKGVVFNDRGIQDSFKINNDLLEFWKTRIKKEKRFKKQTILLSIFLEK